MAIMPFMTTLAKWGSPSESQFEPMAMSQKISQQMPPQMLSQMPQQMAPLIIVP